MEKLIINIPESKSIEISSFLKSMGVIIDNLKPFNMDDYRSKIIKIGSWSEDDLKAFEESRKSSNDFKPGEW